MTFVLGISAVEGSYYSLGTENIGTLLPFLKAHDHEGSFVSLRIEECAPLAERDMEGEAVYAYLLTRN